MATTPSSVSGKGSEGTAASAIGSARAGIGSARVGPSRGASREQRMARGALALEPAHAERVSDRSDRRRRRHAVALELRHRRAGASRRGATRLRCIPARRGGTERRCAAARGAAPVAVRARVALWRVARRTLERRGCVATQALCRDSGRRRLRRTSATAGAQHGPQLCAGRGRASHDRHSPRASASRPIFAWERRTSKTCDPFCVPRGIRADWKRSIAACQTACGDWPAGDSASALPSRPASRWRWHCSPRRDRCFPVLPSS